MYIYYHTPYIDVIPYLSLPINILTYLPNPPTYTPITVKTTRKPNLVKSLYQLISSLQILTIPKPRGFQKLFFIAGRAVRVGVFHYLYYWSRWTSTSVFRGL